MKLLRPKSIVAMSVFGIILCNIASRASGEDKLYTEKPRVERVVNGAGNVANEDRDAFHVPPGFKIEHMFSVPKNELGSWVSMAVDNKGRLIVSDQEGKGLCRVTPPAVGSDGETKVEHLDAKISSAQGLLYAFDSLYVSVNRGSRSALYRLRDTKGSDQFDEVVKLRDLHGPAGEHGPHALRLSPDGKSIYLVCGNHTDPPFDVAEMKTHPEYKSRLPSNWDEDLLLPRHLGPQWPRPRSDGAGWLYCADRCRRKNVEHGHRWLPQ